MPQDFFTTFSLFCTVTIATEISDAVTSVDWLSPDGTAFSSTEGGIALDSINPMIRSANGSAIYTHVLKFNTFQLSHVGEYICRAMINESIITRSFPISIQGNSLVSIILFDFYIISTVPTPVVVSRVNTTGRIFESTNVSLLCNVTVTPLDVESVVNITWFGPNGMITMNDTCYNFNTDRSLLTFTTGLIDNGAQYYCTASYGASVTAARSSLIYPSSDTSDNTTVNVESKLSYMYVYIIYNT